MIAEIP